MLLDISRHVELFDPHKFETPVTIIGAGATGSWLALMLSKLGISDITVYDYDKVEEHNIPNQAYLSISDVGEQKVNALMELIKKATGCTIKIKNEKFTNQRLNGIVFLMVDSMEERKKIWNKTIKLKPSIALLVEPRMGLDVGRVYNVDPINLKHIEEYENTYYSDDVAEVSACGTSQTVITTALSIASWCGRQLINYHNKEELDNEILIDFKFNNIFTTRWQ